MTIHIRDNCSGSSERLKMGPIGPARGSSALFGGAVGPSRMDLGRLETRLGAARGGWALPAHGWGLNHTFARML